MKLLQPSALTTRLWRLWSNTPSIKRQIYAALALFAALVVLVEVSTLLLQRGTTQALLQITEEAAPAIVALEQLVAHATRMESEALSHALLVATGDGAAARAQETLEYRGARDSFFTWLGAYAEHAGRAAAPPDGAVLPRLRTAGDRFARACEALIALPAASGEGAVRAAWAALEAVEDEYMGAVNDALGSEVAAFGAAQRLAARQATLMQILGVSAILVALALCFLLARYLNRAVIGRLGELTRTALEVRPGRSHDGALGRLEALSSPRDELGLLASAFAEMLSRLGGMNRDLEHAATHDALTGVANRTLLVRRLSPLLSEPGRRYALLFIDLDRFKVVNDSLGHAVGDALLVAVSRRLLQNVRDGELVARLGGDEFTVLLSNPALPDAPVRMAERLLADLAHPFTIGGHEIHVSGSVGVVLGGPGYAQPEEVLRDADLAMYEAKAQGVGLYRVFDEAMRRAVLARLNLEVELRAALEGDEFEVVYQPVIELAGGTVAGVEALVCWRHPVAGTLLPGAFMPLAEETGLVVDIDRWVLRQACARVATWRGAAGPLVLSVNLSGQHFARPDLLGTLKDTLLATGFAPGDLRLELTESHLLKANPTTLGNLEALRELGVGLHIDDFGTGYASLGLLRQFATSTLKLDPSLVQGLGGGGAELVRTVLALARGLEMRVVAEGVETREQLELLRAFGCEYAQGHLFAAALGATDAETFLGGAGAQGWAHGDFGPS